MALPVTPPYVFGNVTSSIPLTNLDADFATIYAAVNGIGNGTVSLANVSITGGTISNVSETATSYVATKVISTSSNVGAYSYGTLSYSDVNLFESFSASANTYVQNVLQNTNAGTVASADYVVSNNLGTATTYYGNFGMNGSGWTGTAGTNSFNAPNMVYLTSTTGDLLLGTTTANPIRFATNGGADAMYIDTSGNVGIGTTSPAAKLVIEGGTSSDQFRMGTGANYYKIGRESVSTGYLNFYGTQSGANGYVFGGIDGERMRIDSAGILYVGTTSQFYGACRMNIATGTSGSAPIALQSGNGGFGEVFGNTSGTSLYYPAVFFNNGFTSLAGSISVTGSVTSYNVTSDRRLKENIVSLTNGLNSVLALKPSQYNYIADKEVTYQGFIADEVQAIIPQAVTGEANAVDSEGKPVYQAVDASFLIPHLVSAIQELNAKVDAQAVEIATLKAK